MHKGSDKIDLSVVVVSFNTRQELLNCIGSIFDTRAGLSLEVIVVDNASGDGSADAVASIEGVELIRLDRNIGFAAANNLAVRKARGERLLLLNPDTVLLDGAIAAALELSRRRPGAIIGGRTYFSDGSLNPTSCHGWPTLWSVTCQGLGLSSLFRRSRLFNPEGLGRWQRDTERRVPVITGCFMLMPRQIWNALAGFDEAFFMYGEETDLCMRAAKVGFDRVICPDARLLHLSGASFRTRADRMVRLFAAKARLYRKHWSRPAAAYGVAMLKVWALSRLVGHAFLASVARPKEEYQAWHDIWRRREAFASAAAAGVNHRGMSQEAAPA